MRGSPRHIPCPACRSPHTTCVRGPKLLTIGERDAVQPVKQAVQCSNCKTRFNVYVRVELATTLTQTP
jgi:transcriptional regulator NrdR family protein